MPNPNLEIAALEFANDVRHTLGLCSRHSLSPGRINNTIHSPIGETIGDAQVCPRVVITHDPHREFPIPPNVVTFIQDFDRGKFPHLFIADARNPRLP